MHAERVIGEPRAVRWVVPPGCVPTGLIRDAPAEFGRLFGEGTLTAGMVEHSAVWLWLRDGMSWSATGLPIQVALREALQQPTGWVVEPAPGEVLERVIADLLDGPIGDFVRSHGGSVTAQRDGDSVVVQLGGACEHCRAAEFTLRSRLVTELRRRCPDLAELDDRPGSLTLALSGAVN